MTRSCGIDYSLGMANVDYDTNIRYGVIPANSVAWWDESAEIHYDCENCEAYKPCDEDDPTSEKECTNECAGCEASFYIDNEEYEAFQDSQGDIFITRSKYYTYAAFCSPCAPGACHLENPLFEDGDTLNDLNDIIKNNSGNKCYCFGPDMFANDCEYLKCKYPVFEVGTDKLIFVTYGNK